MSSHLSEVPAPAAEEEAVVVPPEAAPPPEAAAPPAPEPEADPEPEAEQKPPKLLQEALPGDWAGISSDFGGDAPTVAEIRMLGGSIPITGSFAKGTEIELRVRVRIAEVHGVDVLDGWGNTKQTIRRHRARLISVERFGK